MSSTPQAPSARARLQVCGLHKRYGTVTALAGVDLRIDAGEFVALLGPNGAGKSTLYQILSGLFHADQGDVRLCGHAVSRAPTRALAHLGLVFQEPTLDLDLSVAANLSFHAGLHGLGRARARRRIREELERAGLWEQRRTRCRALSGGNRRKVELARALLHEPDVLALDECTVGLDVASRADIIEHVRGLCRDRGVAVLWATHLVDEAEGAQRIVVLHRGRVLAEGDAAALTRAGGASSLSEAFLALTDQRRSPAGSPA